MHGWRYCHNVFLLNWIIISIFRLFFFWHLFLMQFYDSFLFVFIFHFFLLVSPLLECVLCFIFMRARNFHQFDSLASLENIKKCRKQWNILRKNCRNDEDEDVIRRCSRLSSLDFFGSRRLPSFCSILAFAIK